MEHLKAFFEFSILELVYLGLLTLNDKLKCFTVFRIEYKMEV